MADRTCPKCDKAFAKPCLLKRHLQRVKPCSPLLSADDLLQSEMKKPHECRFCRRRFTQHSNMQVHIRSACKVAQHMARVYSSERDKQMRQQAADIESLRAQVQALTTQVQSPNVHIGNIVNGNVNVVLNVFGNEQTSHIDSEHVRGILDGILRTQRDPSSAALEALLQTALLIYSDPAHPENVTCYIPNKKQATSAMVHVGGSGGSAWAVRPMQLVVPPMVQRSMDTLVREQPFDDADRYADIMRALIANEQSYQECGQLRAVLINNKGLLDRIVKSRGADSNPPPPHIAAPP